MRVFIFGMIGPPHGFCVRLCMSVREKSREEAQLWLFEYIKINIF